MSFDYKQSGLPANDTWELATKMCNRWLNTYMTMFGPERIANFMNDQPVTAAKNLLAHCADASPESVIVALLGPAKGALMAEAELDTLMRHTFGDRAVDLVRTLADPANATDAAMKRDAERIFIVEGLSTMTDQMIGRQKIDGFHQKRWNILRSLESGFEDVRGKDPALDALFIDALKKSRETLEALDNAASAGKKPPKPPGM
ncbi:MAG TPA: hypothetical protein PLW48_08515 [Alphaproteobacteria bacterium]|nr:hypothetical protein [Rhodospirillaceae bacterium]HRJ67166.1 hypothetical protein [Alphaproteobacteria bacterium]